MLRDREKPRKTTTTTTTTTTRLSRRFTRAVVMSPITCARLTVFTVLAVVLQIVGVSLFVFGFFPVKPALSGVSGPESYHAPFCDSAKNVNESDSCPDKRRLLYQELSEISPSFDRLVFMVIDGLPAEFVLGRDGQPPPKVLRDAMPYTQSLLSNAKAIGYHAKAAPPTVTMPRLKAMVSGAIGGFLDVAFNFNTQALLDDNLLDQFSRIGWEMVMLGDDTWLKLFPGLFSRYDGVSSFFVKDTVQVDHNVSRHLSDELKSDDWSLLILHYLGLDHVGHIGGRNSFLMASKLTEMDEVVRMIHSRAIEEQDDDQGQTLLVIVSDHGMTENGNHGGSSYEETDSLLLFVGVNNSIKECGEATNDVAYQVDIAPTLALLIGVPIPKNNVGVLVSKTIEPLKDHEQLRALQLNSWQLLRLLQAQLPGLLCESSPFVHETDVSDCGGNTDEQLLCLYTNAAVLHSLWKSKEATRSNTREDFSKAFDAYIVFLKSASEWLSSKTTEKPVSLLGLGVATMLLSCLFLLSLLACLYREVYSWSKIDFLTITPDFSLEEGFIVAVVLILIVSMGSSSMVEEEHYIWHFMVSTFYLLLLRKAAQSLSVPQTQKARRNFHVCSVLLLLICGRVLRGWHQGGVNWTYLPDVSKWLEKLGRDYIKWIHVVSTFLVIGLGLFTLIQKGTERKNILVVVFSFLASGLLVLLHVMKYQDDMFLLSNQGATLSAQTVYAILGMITTVITIILPWCRPLSTKMCSSSSTPSSLSKHGGQEDRSLSLEISDSLYISGLTYLIVWCLLQLLLQQPINSGVIFLLVVQILAMLSLSHKSLHLKEWVEVAALYYMGMAGHYALGNSNTLATIDVAGAFIGLSSHSTLISGILMFIITYASPLLFHVSLVMYIAVRRRNPLPSSSDSDSDTKLLLKSMLAFPCLVPLGINSILVTSYTIVLLLMRNHLFVWSVFTPKYLYVCATSLATYLGVCIVAATVTYTHWVLALRNRNQILSG